jgi:hypothetical protein
MPDEHNQPVTETQVREAHRIHQDQVSSTAFYQNFLLYLPKDDFSSFNQQCAQVVQESLNTQGRKTTSDQEYFSLKDSAMFLDLSVKQLVQLEKKKLFPEFMEIEKISRIPAWVLFLHHSVEAWRNDKLNIRKVFGGEDEAMQSGDFSRFAAYHDPNGFMAKWDEFKGQKDLKKD